MALKKLHCDECRELIGIIQVGSGYLIDDPYCGITFMCPKCKNIVESKHKIQIPEI